jgi:hypothetical protein
MLSLSLILQMINWKNHLTRYKPYRCPLMSVSLFPISRKEIECLLTIKDVSTYEVHYFGTVSVLYFAPHHHSHHSSQTCVASIHVIPQMSTSLSSKGQRQTVATSQQICRSLILPPVGSLFSIIKQDDGERGNAKRRDCNGKRRRRVGYT